MLDSVSMPQTIAPLQSTNRAEVLESEVARVGERLARAMNAVLAAIPNLPSGPTEAARLLGIDKVLASRVFKAVRSGDPMVVAHMIPGPDPLRRMIRGAAAQGVSAQLLEVADQAIEEFDQFVRRETGDRSSLAAVLSAWLPEARREFELRRKQSAFKAMSQLKGCMAEVNVSTVILAPAADPQRLDVFWLFGEFGIQRLRPNVTVKFTTRRLVDPSTPRHPMTLAGAPVENLNGLRLDQFAVNSPGVLEVHRSSEMVQYMLGDNGFGPRSAVDVVFAEANRSELPRTLSDPKRRTYVFAEVVTPLKLLIFDLLVHRDLEFAGEPELLIYDTVLDGIASANDRNRDFDLLDMQETIQPLGPGLARLRTADVPHYVELMRHVCAAAGLDPEALRTYRTRIEYPIYGSQVTMAFRTTAPA